MMPMLQNMRVATRAIALDMKSILEGSTDSNIGNSVKTRMASLSASLSEISSYRQAISSVSQFLKPKDLENTVRNSQK